MALIPCGNCGWMCSESDPLCNMCGIPLRSSIGQICFHCKGQSRRVHLTCEWCHLPWRAVAPPPPPPAGIPMHPISMNQGIVPGPGMLHGQPPPPPPPSPMLPVLGRILPNRLMPDSDLAENPRLMCIDCGEIVGNRPRTCPRCGLAPDQDSIYAREMAEKIARAMSRCEGARAWTTLGNSASRAVWVDEKRLLLVLHDCLKLHGSVRADNNVGEIVARIEIRTPEGMCALTVDAKRGRIGGGGPTHDHDPTARLIDLKEPRRIFRWLTWVGLTGLEQHTT